MSIWAIADLHLSKGTPSKDMAYFGPKWKGYMDVMEEAWKESVGVDDLVLIPGDLSWARTLKEASLDFDWLDALPGTKLLVRGNHDSWWSSSKKMKLELPPTVFFIQNNAFDWNNRISIAGARLWDTQEYRFDQFIKIQENRRQTLKTVNYEADRRIFDREVERLKLSLSDLNPKASLKIAMTHYPPIGADLKPSTISEIFGQFGIHLAVFGHLHNVFVPSLFGKSKEGIHYYLTSSDFLNFRPLKIL